MDYYKRKLMSKNGEVILRLSRELITYNVGDRIKTIEEYAKGFGTGRGTIQSGIKFLRNEEAIDLESRGHLGTFILSIDHKKLWNISDLGTIVGVMPLPYSKRYEGLATGLYKSFERADIPFSLAFMRGANRRLDTIGFGKYDFAVTSKLAINHDKDKFSSMEIIQEFGEKSYVGEHVVIFTDKHETKIQPKMRIGIDPDSIDQMILTNYECTSLDVEFVEISYAQIFHNIKNNIIDAAIWNGDELGTESVESVSYGIAPLSNSKAIDISREDTVAVVVAEKNNRLVKDFLLKVIDVKEIRKIQEKVMAGEMIPTY